MRRKERFVRLRVSQRADTGEVIPNFLCCRRLSQDVGILTALKSGREGVSSLVERFCGYNRGRKRRRLIKILQEGPAKRYDRFRGVHGYPCEQGEVLAAVDVGSEMSSRRVGEQDE